MLTFLPTYFITYAKKIFINENILYELLRIDFFELILLFWYFLGFLIDIIWKSS